MPQNPFNRVSRHFISVFISFVVILAVIYVLFKVLRLEKLDLAEEEEK